MAASKIAQGVIPALITPFTQNGIDTKALRRLLDYLLANNVHGIFANSSTGEYNNLSREERETVLEVVCDHVQGRVPIFANASALSVKEAIKNGKTYAKYGVNALVYTPPFYYKYSQEELIRFFTMIADEVPLPIMIYNHVSLKNIVELPAIVKLAEHPNIVGIKDTTVNMRGFLKTVTTLKDKPTFSLLQGTEGLFTPSVVLGGDGGVLALACVAPKLFCEIYETRHDSARCMELEQQVQKLLEVLSVAGDYSKSINNFLISIHAALAALGICNASPSQLVDSVLNKDSIARARKILVEAKVIEA